MHRQGRRAQSEVLRMGLLLQNKIDWLVRGIGCEEISTKDVEKWYLQSKKGKTKIDVITKRAPNPLNTNEFSVYDNLTRFVYDYCIYHYCYRFGSFEYSDYIDNRTSEMSIVRFAFLIRRRLDIKYYHIFNEHYKKLMLIEKDSYRIYKDELAEFFSCYLAFCLLKNYYNHDYYSTENLLSFITERVYNKIDKKLYIEWLNKLK